MVKQYPDTITLTTKGESTKDPQGDWVVNPATVTTAVFDCRYEPNTGNRFLVGEDGSRIDYSGTVYLKTKNEIALGTGLEILRHNGSMIRGSVRGFNAGQMNARIWL